jgi:hypothetical protein
MPIVLFAPRTIADSKSFIGAMVLSMIACLLGHVYTRPGAPRFSCRICKVHLQL